MSPRSLAAALCLFAILVLAPTAQASWLDTALQDCGSTPFEHPFTQWLDPLPYVPVPNGDLEGGSSWRLSAGAGIVAGNESFYVGGADDRHSLALPAGASAVTPATCLGIDRPTVRFFARRTSGGLLDLASVLKVDVIYEDASGSVLSLPLLPATGGTSWAPSLPTPVVANLIPQLGGAAAVAFRFTAVGGSWLVDDVYVDPYAKY